jgi:hypothetical protein
MGAVPPPGALTRRMKTNRSQAPRSPACDPRAMTIPGRCTSKPCPLRARSTGQPGYLTVTNDNLLPELTRG